MSIQYFSHIGICVRDMDVSLKFYKNAMDFRLISGTTVGSEVASLMGVESDEIVLHSRFIERDGTRLELMCFEQPKTTASGELRDMTLPGLTHLAVRVENAAATAKLVEKYGGKVLNDSRVGIEEAAIELVYIQDPDGTRIELIQVPGEPSAPLGDPMS